MISHARHCILNYYLPNFSATRFFRQQRKQQTFTLLILYEGNPLVSDGFPSQRASDAENISMLWCHIGRTPMWRVRTDVPQSLSSTVPLFTSPLYVSQSRCSPTLYSSVPILPSPFLPPRGTPYISQSLCFPSPFTPQSLCSPAPLFPSLDISHKWLPIPMFPNVFPSLYVPLDLLFPRPDLHQNCFQSQFTPKMFPSPYVPHKCFHSLCSPKIFPSPYVPQSLCSPVHRDWGT